MNSTPEQEVVARLRSTMFDAAASVRPEEVAARMPVAALIGHEIGHGPGHVLGYDAGRDVTDLRPRRRAVAPMLAAAAIAVLAAGVTLFAASGHEARPAGAGSPQTVADTFARGGFTYVVVSGPTETLRTWIPANRAGTWQFFNSNLSGSARKQRGACAAFPGYVDSNGSVPGCDGGSWATYRPKFADSLPSDPHAVLASMRAAYAPRGDAQTFNTGFNFVSLGWAQPAAVAKIVAALRLIHGVTVTSHPHGRTTIAYSGRIKATPVEYWSLTVDSAHRVVATSSSYGPHAPLNEKITYRHVTHLGDSA